MDKLRAVSVLVFAVFYGFGHSRLSYATSLQGRFLDEGGAVYNVLAYGAKGDGKSDDARAIQAAINAAASAGGGVVYFPAGAYLLNATVHVKRAYKVSLTGAGLGTIMLVKSEVGISFSGSLTPPYRSGEISHMQIECSDGSSETAVRMIDAVAPPSLFDLVISKCRTGFDIVNRKYWTERLFAENITDNHNEHLFHFDQNPADRNNSYGYGTYDGIYVNAAAGQDVFYLTGGAYLYHSTFIVKGNFVGAATRAAVFNVQGAVNEPCPGAAWNSYDIAVEGRSYSVVRADDNGCRGGAAGGALVAGQGPINAVGALNGTNDMIFSTNKAAYFVGQLNTTTKNADTLVAKPVSPYSRCYVEPGNAVAAGLMSRTYVSRTDWGKVIVAHPAVGGGAFEIWCN